MSTGRMIERLMVLDAVLDDATFTWLATEFDKRSSRPSGSHAGSGDTSRPDSL